MDSRVRPHMMRMNGARHLAALATLLPMLVVGCSHTSPYVAPHAMGTTTDVDVDAGALVTRVLLIGDAGEPVSGEPVLAELRRWAAEHADRTVVVFLGDNVYPRGLADESDAGARADGMRRLTTQIDAVRDSGARGIFIPGNHDWAHGSLDGLAAIERQARVVDDALGAGAFLPRGGCAGPTAVDLDGVRLVVFDSEWFLQKTPASPCPDSDETMARGLARLVGEAGDRAVLVLGHHPMATHGTHGGFFDWKDHLFPLTRLAPWAYVPLPVVGSLYPLVRGTLNPSSQDLGSARYDHFVEVVSDAVRPYRPLLYVSGHEHVLQVLDGGEAFGRIVVSGAGSQHKLGVVGHGDDTRFAHAHVGFMCVDVLSDGRVALRVIEPGEGVVYSEWLTPGGPS